MALIYDDLVTLVADDEPISVTLSPFTVGLLFQALDDAGVDRKGYWMLGVDDEVTDEEWDAIQKSVARARLEITASP
jgi:hypothetical protein